MPNAVLGTANMYAAAMIREPLMSSFYALLTNPSRFQYSNYGLQTLVREVYPGNFAAYDDSVGWDPTAGTGGSATWSAFQPMNDRQFTIKVPAMSELNAIMQGYALDGPEIIKQSWQNFGAEVDAATASSIYSKTQSGNIFNSLTLPVDNNNILGTLSSLRAKLFKTGYPGACVAFISTDIWPNIEQEIINKFGLSNDTVLTYNPTNKEELAVTVQVYKYQNMVLVETPSDRMYTSVIIKDGKSAGQTDGGYAAATGAQRIGIQLLPFDAAVMSIRHLVLSVSVPLEFENLVKGVGARQDIETLNRMYKGSVTMPNIGVYQQGDDFLYANRVIYDTAVFNSWIKTLFCVTNSTVGVTAAGSTVTVTFPLGENPLSTNASYTVTDTTTSTTLTVNSVSVSGQIATLTMSAALTAGHNISVASTTADGLTWSGTTTV